LKIYDYISRQTEQKELVDDAKVIVVDIDEKSLQYLGQWPWPRVLLAEIIQKTAAVGAGAIVMDIIFAEKDRTSPKEIAKFYNDFFHIRGVERTIPEALQDNDAIFAKVMRDNAVVGTLFLSNEQLPHKECMPKNRVNLEVDDLHLKTYEHIMCNTPKIQQALQISGFVNSFKDKDGIYQWFNYKGLTYVEDKKTIWDAFA